MDRRDCDVRRRRTRCLADPRRLGRSADRLVTCTTGACQGFDSFVLAVGTAVFADTTSPNDMCSALVALMERDLNLVEILASARRMANRAFRLLNLIDQIVAVADPTPRKLASLAH